MSKLPDQSKRGELLLYQTEDGKTRIQVRFQGETVWLPLSQMAELFQRDKSVISRHIRNIFDEGELRQESVVAKFATTAADGKTYQVEYFNLDVFISVGSRPWKRTGNHERGIRKKSHSVIARREAPWQSHGYPASYEIASTLRSSLLRRTGRFARNDK